MLWCVRSPCVLEAFFVVEFSWLRGPAGRDGVFFGHFGVPWVVLVWFLSRCYFYGMRWRFTR